MHTGAQMPSTRITVKQLKTVKRYSSPKQVTSELWSITCRMGSHSVTFHPTQVNVPHLTPAAQTGRPTQLTNRRGVIELFLLFVLLFF